MKTYTINLDSDAVSFIERLNYEYETLKDNVSYMINHFRTDSSFLQSSLFREYQKAEIKAKINFERGMQEIYEKYIPEKFREHKMGWNVDFRKKQINIILYCDCEV